MGVPGSFAPTVAVIEDPLRHTDTRLIDTDAPAELGGETTTDMVVLDPYTTMTIVGLETLFRVIPTTIACRSTMDTFESHTLSDSSTRSDPALKAFPMGYAGVTVSLVPPDCGP